MPKKLKLAATVLVLSAGLFLQGALQTGSEGYVILAAIFYTLGGYLWGLSFSEEHQGGKDGRNRTND